MRSFTASFSASLDSACSSRLVVALSVARAASTCASNASSRRRNSSPKVTNSSFSAAFLASFVSITFSTSNNLLAISSYCFCKAPSFCSAAALPCRAASALDSAARFFASIVFIASSIFSCIFSFIALIKLSAFAPDVDAANDAFFAASRSTRAASSSRRHVAIVDNASSGAPATSTAPSPMIARTHAKSSSLHRVNRFTSSVSASVVALPSLAARVSFSFNRRFSSRSAAALASHRARASRIARCTSFQFKSLH
mmetsp:Transcript_7742/g.31052  ORF Transcript_7742/g.31052 Transcript_7742/m.31052 type:complete len:255 (-) Transcript_7742:247-1011(-)